VQADPAKVNDLVLSPDGAQAITVGEDTLAKVWNTADGAAVRQLAAAQANLTRLALRPDGVQVAGADGQGRVYVWTYANGALAQTLETGAPVLDLAFNTDNQRLAAINADKLRVYDAAAIEPSLLSELASPTPLAAVAFAPEKTILTGGADKQLTVWADASPTAVRTFAGHGGPVYSVACSADNQWIASASADATIRLWDVTAGSQIRQLAGHTGPVYAVAFDAKGERLLSGGADGVLRVWNAASGGLLKSLSEGESPSPLFATAFSPDGQFAAAGGSAQAIHIWNVDSGAVMKALAGPADSVYQLAFNQPGSRLLSCGQAGSLTVWNVGDGAPAFTGNAPHVLYAGTYSRDGSAIAIAAASGSTVFLTLPAAAR
jgi:WD40 repeat protein